MFKRMKIGHRLFLGFGLILFLMAVVIVTEIETLKRMQDELETIVLQANARNKMANAVTVHAYGTALDVRAILLLGHDERSKERMRQTHDRLAETRKAYDDGYAGLKNLCLLEGRGDPYCYAAELAGMEALADSSRRLQDNGVQLALAGRMDEATDIIIEKTFPVVQRWLRSTDTMVENEYKRTSLAYKKADKRYTRLHTSMLALVALATALAVAISMALARSITVPLKVATRLVVSGDQTVDISGYKEGREELGDMILAFSRNIAERQRAEEMLIETKALVEAVVENIPHMILLKEATDLRFVMFNRAGEDLLGYDRSALLGKNDLDLFPPEQAAHFMAKDREVLDGTTGMLDIPEEPILTAKKGTRLLHTRKVSIRGGDGTTKYLLGISEDITERKQAETALYDSEKKYRELFDNASDAIFIADTETSIILDANQAAETLLGRARSEIIGMNRGGLHPSAQGVQYDEIFVQHVSSGHGTDIESEVVRKDGTIVPVRISAKVIDVAGRHVIQGIFRDVTAHKKAETMLRASEEKFRMLVEHQGEGIGITDQNDVFTYVNPAAERIFGTGPGQLAGRAVTEFLDPVELEHVRQQSAIRRGGDESRYELAINDATGRRKNLGITAVPQYDGAGAIIGTFGIIRDNTESKREQLLQDSLYRISELSLTAKNLGELYVGTHAVVGQLMPAGNIYLAILDEQTGLLTFPYFVDQYDPRPDPRPPGNGLTDQVLRTGVPVLKNHETDPGLGSVETIGHPAKSWLGVPLRTIGKTFGAMVVQIYEATESYGQRESDILSFVSDHVATAIMRKRSEAALIASEQRFQQVSESTGEWVWEVDPDGVFIYSNTAVESILGYRPDELVGKKRFHEQFAPETRDDVRHAALKELSEQKPIRGFVNPNLHKDGRVVILETNGMPNYNSAGEFLGYRGTCKDITMRRALEEERERLIAELQDSLVNIKTLKGLVPICSSCKKIRDDKGYWQQVEVYVAKHTEADFSHGLCEDCAHKLYPEYFADKQNKQ